MEGAREKRPPLELRRWEQTRLVLEGVFSVPRLTGTFPFSTGYEVLFWPSVLVHIVVIILSLLCISLIPYIDPDYCHRGGLLYIFVVRIVKCTTASIYNILSPLWMIYNHKCLKKLLRNVTSVEKEMGNGSLKLNCKHKHLPFLFFPVIGSVIVLMQFVFLYLKCGFLCAFSLAIVVLVPFPALSYVWQYLALHDVLRSLMVRISKLDEADSFVNSYHSLVMAYRAVDKLYGLQAKAVNEQLYKRMVYEDNNNLIHDELLAFHLSSCRKLVFTACGFFNLDNSLICSMIACATTYLVIMLQFTLPTTVHTNLNQSFAHF
ncbi:unnamed protein product [Nezara viridula]|uniref:Gustatory receptor n=1 Tax=Nezara viridula TaxID=85310 RepID=A0A9P0HM22_NEZVI|nr:unnamed protein product [Nezara viridula]